MNIKNNLNEYIKKNVFPQYSKNENRHGIIHIKYVIKRCDELIREKNNINNNTLFTIAAYHDIDHYIDAKKHEIISATIMMNDNKLKQIFNENELQIIKDAIEDHRASSKRIPRSIYGKIISSADRSTDVSEILERSYIYRRKYFPKCSKDELIEKTYIHIKDKYGNNDMQIHLLKIKNMIDF